jgi:predicted DNA-binding transcriptional regulator YafY
MRRTDRLYALVEELRSRAPRPVGRARLARHLEVTPRTVERDILALQQAGVPIWSQRGRGGGYAIDPRWSLPPLNFDATEALAVIAALTAARSLPFAAAGQRALNKVLAAMSTSEASRARELAGRMRLGTFGNPGARAIVAAVERAVEHRSTIRIGYRDRDGAVTSRPVEAHGMHLTATGSYLVGWCRLRDGGRMFRLDRITSVRDTGETAPPRDLASLLDPTEDAVAPDVVPPVVHPADLPGEEGSDAMPTKSTKSSKSSTSGGRGRWGAPRKAENRTGATPGFVRAIAGALPGMSATDRRGVTSFAVDGHPVVDVDDEDDSVVIFPATEGSDGEGDDEGDDEGDGETEQTLVLRTVGRDELRAAITAAWEAHASPDQVRAHRKERARWEALPAVTADDIREAVLALPGAAEGPIWGQDLGFLIGDVKKTRFARFGPPEGGRVSNLLPPDDQDTLVILVCEQRPELLAAGADRFFTTPHYGGPDEPGGIILRLAEHRGPDALAEIAELLEDAWRSVAPPDLVAQLDGP